MAYIDPNISASGITFAQHQSMGVSGHLEALITANSVATSAPVTALTVSASGVSTAGGSLAAGGYLLKFTETNGLGETTVSPESAAMTVAAGNIPLITRPALHAGNNGWNIYATAANGASNSEVLYATGITSATFAMSAAAPTNSFAQTPPTVNSTSLAFAGTNGAIQNKATEFVRNFEHMNGQQVYLFVSKLVNSINRGDPVTFRAGMERLRQAHVTFSILAQLCHEMGVLMDANPGTIKPVTDGIGNSTTKRTWP